MSNKRTNQKKLFKCSICSKADWREIVPGQVTFFDRCTLTENCAGRLTIDPNAVATTRSSLTWQQTPTIYKTTFTKQRTLVVSHNFGHYGSIVVEVFIEIQTSTGIVRIKTSQFVVQDQTENSVTVDLLTTRTGVIVVTDNQYSLPTAVTQVTWTPPNLLTTNILTVASDQDATSFIMELKYKPINSVNSVTTPLTFQRHLKSAIPVGGTLWGQYRIIAMEKPYYLYSTIVPTPVLQKGTAVQLVGTIYQTTTTPAIIWPMATSDKTAASDIVANKIIRNSSIRLGDLIIDNTMLIVANLSIIEELRKPFTIY
jgi:hypothetical protein